MIRLLVPGTLSYRNIAVRVVDDACRRVGRSDGEPCYDGNGEFEAEAVSAFGEAFNNIAIHGYAGMLPGEVDITVSVVGDEVTIELLDTGRTFDPSIVPSPALEDLPEGGMGLFIIRSFMDTVEYVPGPPNLLRITKRLKVSESKAPPSEEGVDANAEATASRNRVAREQPSIPPRSGS